MKVIVRLLSVVLAGILLPVIAPAVHAATPAPPPPGVLVPATGTSYEIVSRASGRCVDVTDHSQADGANIQQWACSQNGNQRWRFAPTDDGHYTVTNVHSGKVLDIAGTTADGANVQQWTNARSANQQWRLQDAGNGYVRIISRISSKALDVAGASTANGANIQQWAAGTGTNQQWLIRPIGTVTPPTEPVPATLRAAGAAAGVTMGAAVANGPLRSEPAYARTLSREYGMVVSENEFKMEATQPRRGQFTFTEADALAAFAQANGQKLRGHTLIWHTNTPDWVKQIWNRDELIGVMRTHIRTVMGRYKGRIDQWDVVNEAFADNGTLRAESHWGKVIGPEYIDLAFRFAREADPAAKLYYVDYNTERLNAKSDAVLSMVKGMRARGVPIDGVGFQAHIRFNYDLSTWETNLERFDDAGFDTAYTEVDVAIQLPSTAAKQEAQAQVYSSLLGICIRVSRCSTFVSWGFTDRHSWVPGFTPGYGDALPFNVDYVAKPAHRAMIERLRQSTSGARTVS